MSAESRLLNAEIVHLRHLLECLVDAVPEHMLDPEGEDNDRDLVTAVNNAKHYLGRSVE